MTTPGKLRRPVKPGRVALPKGAEPTRYLTKPSQDPPFGHRLKEVEGENLVNHFVTEPHPEENATILALFALTDGGRGARTVAEHLNAMGRFRRDEPWTADSVNEALRRRIKR